MELYEHPEPWFTLKYKLRHEKLFNYGQDNKCLSFKESYPKEDIQDICKYFNICKVIDKYILKRIWS